MREKSNHLLYEKCAHDEVLSIGFRPLLRCGRILLHNERCKLSHETIIC